jgi:hypothetical protein
MNWGNKLLLVFALFGGGISYMVYRCMQTPVDLVSKDYYKDELTYQYVIDGAHRAAALSAQPLLSAIPAGVHIQLPPEMKRHSLSGRIRFYCAADAGRDRDIVLAPGPDGSQTIPKETLLPGQYTVSISWETGGTNYFSQQALNLH